MCLVPVKSGRIIPLISETYALQPARSIFAIVGIISGLFNLFAINLLLTDVAHPWGKLRSVLRIVALVLTVFQFLVAAVPTNFRSPAEKEGEEGKLDWDSIERISHTIFAIVSFTLGALFCWSLAIYHWFRFGWNYHQISREFGFLVFVFVAAFLHAVEEKNGSFRGVSEWALLLLLSSTVYLAWNIGLQVQALLNNPQRFLSVRSS